MKIKTVLNQDHKDLTVIYVCEHCHNAKQGVGFDDPYFMSHVVPEIPCNYCGKTSHDSHSTYSSEDS